MKLRSSLSSLALVGVLAASIPLGMGTFAVAADARDIHGPDPTSEALRTTGPFETAQEEIPGSAVQGFGGGTVYYPTTTSEGTFGGVAVAPGYTEGQGAVSWLGERLSSHGFVVITIDTLSVWDQPDQRGRQLLAALKYLTEQSPAKDRVNPETLAVMGHSMGGGGALEAAKADPSIDAAIPLAPWHGDKDWPEITTPTFLIGADNDSIAPIADHADLFYRGLTAPREKAYLVLKNADHWTTNGPDGDTSEYSISWLKRFLDADTRYVQFLCPGPTDTVASYESTCPFD